MIKKIFNYLENNFKAQTWTFFGLVILNIIAFIILADKVYFRLDLTSEENYSISKPTADLLKKLDNKLIMEYYYNDKFKEHSQMSKIALYVEDILKEYERNGRGNVTVIVKELNAEKDAELIDKIDKQYQIQALPLSERQKAEAKTSLGISGLVIKYKDDQRSIPVVFTDNDFEYTLDSELKKMIEKEGDTVGIILGSADKEMNRDFKAVYEMISSEYRSVKVLNSGENIPDDVSLLFVMGASKLTDYDTFVIDQYLVNGGKAFIALSGNNIIIDQRSGQVFGFPAQNKLIDMLKNYGIRINSDLVGDNDSYVPYQDQAGVHRYPIWLRIKQENFNRSNPLFNGLTGLMLFWSSSIDFEDSIKNKGVVLAKTTPNAWSLKDSNFRLDPGSYENDKAKPGEKSYNVVCSYEGPIDSFFKDKKIPENKDSQDKFLKEKIDKGSTKLVVISNEYFLWDPFLRQSQENQLFLLNTLDSLSKDQSLIDVRKKGKFLKPLDKVRNETQKEFRKNLIIVISTVFVPLLFIALAIALNILRLRRNQEVKSKYSNENK